MTQFFFVLDSHSTNAMKSDHRIVGVTENIISLENRLVIYFFNVHLYYDHPSVNKYITINSVHIAIYFMVTRGDWKDHASLPSQSSNFLGIF